MVGKTYLRYNAEGSSGVISSTLCQNIQSVSIPIPKGRGYTVSQFLIVAALEYVNVVNLRTGRVEASLKPKDAKFSSFNEVSSLILHSDQRTIAVGYGTGYIAVFRLPQGASFTQTACVIYGLSHKPNTQVLSLNFDGDGLLLATGGQDTDITVWDMLSQEPQYRLRGHRGGVVSVIFVQSLVNRNSNVGKDRAAQYLISGAADGLVKVWDLHVQQCIQTIIASDAQITRAVMDASGSRLMVGLRENLLKVYSCDKDSHDAGETYPQLLKEHGVISRKSNKAVSSILFSPDSNYMAVVSSNNIEFFRVSTQEEVKRKVQRKRKRKREKNEPEEDPVSIVPTATEELVHIRSFYFEKKIRAFAFLSQHSHVTEEVLFVITFADNSIQSFSTSEAVSGEGQTGANERTLAELQIVHRLEVAGHRQEIKHSILSSDNTTLCTLSGESIKLWGVSRTTTNETSLEDDELQMPSNSSILCIGGPSIVDDEAICVAFLPGDRVIAVGTKAGAILLISLNSNEVLSSLYAHGGSSVHSMTLSPDQSGLCSVGADRRLLLCHFHVDADENKGSEVVSLRLSQETELNQIPLFIQFSPDGKLCGVALQDHSIQLFFADSFKPFLSLYGHKLPATALDFSVDGTLCVSVGMDKSLRFWGTDFGDCHRAIHAHDDYITDVKFVGHTHFVFTASLDGTLKHWDGDYWTLIQAFHIHHRGVWTLALSHDGTCAVSAGVDRCIRVLYRTEEMIFPEEEEEKVALEAMDEEAARKAAMQALVAKDAEVALAGQQTAATNMAAEKLMEALDFVSVELQRQQAQTAPTQETKVFLKNRTVWEYLWSVIEKIRPSELRHALSALTSLHTASLIEYMERMIDEGAVINTEVAAKIILALVKPAPGTSNKVLVQFPDHSDGLQRLHRLRTKLTAGLAKDSDRLGFNIAGLRFVKNALEDTEKIKFFDVSRIQGAKRKFNKRLNEE